MNWLTAEQQSAIRKYATEMRTAEVCGVVLNDGSVVKLDNKADDPVNHFKIDPVELAAYDDKIVGVWHSHLELDGFSPHDQAQINAGDWCWAVYVLPKDRFWEVDLTAEAPIVGRPYCWGVYDCASIVEDWYRKADVPWPAYERGAYGEWDAPGFDAFDRLWPEVGIEVSMESRAKDDMVQMSVSGNHTDHIGVLITPDRLLHHPAERLSMVSVYGEQWKRQTVPIVRPHKRCAP